ncbi:hypothetical protein HED48_12985 [Ochrobactrum intermedium]|nr:hypothetical protein [Brucella intermedia]
MTEFINLQTEADYEAASAEATASNEVMKRDFGVQVVRISQGLELLCQVIFGGTACAACAQGMP